MKSTVSPTESNALIHTCHVPQAERAEHSDVNSLLRETSQHVSGGEKRKETKLFSAECVSPGLSLEGGRTGSFVAGLPVIQHSSGARGASAEVQRRSTAWLPRP